jgi:hypothetical protein
MAEVFLATAWAAGVVEGGSVLVHAAKNSKENEGKTSMIFTSVLYGTLALPLGIIGASPGPSVIASLPYAPSLKALECLDSEKADSDQKPTKLQESRETTNDENDEKEQLTPLISRSEMIRKVREDNRRSLVRKQHPPAPPTRPKQRTTPTKFLSGLDGRPLSTPLAEGMRRARFLFMGTSLVMSVVSYEQWQQEAKQTSTQLQRQGRDAQAIQSLVEHASKENGVVVRLVGHYDRLEGLLSRSSGVVVPLLYPTNGNPLPTTNDTPAYWNLGNTPQEWRQVPLTRDWLLRSRDQAPSLVVEADVSSSSPLSTYLSPQQEDAPVDRAMWVSTILGMVARQNGVLPPQDDHETNAGLVNVIIGSGKRHAKLEDINTIYINGPSVVGVEVASLLERMHSHVVVSSAQSEEVEVLVEVEAAAPVEPPLRFPFSLFEFVGAKLRQVVAHTVTAVTTLLPKGDDKVVHVVSDHSSVALWLRRTLTEWNVSWYNAHSGIANYHDAIVKNEDVTFVSCQSDEATCCVICSLLTDDTRVAPSRIVALVEEESCASMLTTLVAELNKDAHVEILCIKSIHTGRFEHVRHLLANGKTPSQVQELIDLIE